MRKELGNINGVRRRFIGTFVRYGVKPAYRGPMITTLLFSNIRDVRGKVYSDHIWFTTTKGFERYNFNEGDNCCFDARVKSYVKGYRGNRDEDFYEDKPLTRDYKLSHPNNIVKSEIAKAGLLF